MSIREARRREQHDVGKRVQMTAVDREQRRRVESAFVPLRVDRHEIEMVPEHHRYVPEQRQHEQTDGEQEEGGKGGSIGHQRAQAAVGAAANAIIGAFVNKEVRDEARIDHRHRSRHR